MVILLLLTATVERMVKRGVDVVALLSLPIAVYMVGVVVIGPQGTSMCSQGPRVRRIPYKSGLFFTPFCKKILGFIS